MNETQDSAKLQGALRPAPRFPKQAIVMIHGIGEQTPMDTIRSFVNTAWKTDQNIHDNKKGFPKPGEVWSKPDTRTGSLELRRITTRESRTTDTFKKDGVRSDFYELYWADLLEGSTWGAIKEWLAGLLFRNPPRGVRLAWVLLWLATLTVAVLTIATVLPRETLADIPGLRWLAGWPAWVLAVLAAALAYGLRRVVVPYVGDVVRYTRADPENIAARRDIRDRGLQLLRELHTAEYERIIIVGHSLGSILAYDLVSYYWSQNSQTHTVRTDNPDEFKALRELERAVATLEKSPADEAAIKNFHAAQSTFCRLLRKRSKPDTRWLITDLVTLGSPLTHAEFLLANGLDDLSRRKQEREFPTCPPVREKLDAKTIKAATEVDLPVGDKELFCFPLDPEKPDTWRLHHAAPFAVVRWTNIYDPARLVFWGDIISGALAPVFGAGVIDINLRTVRGQGGLFTHTHYWRNADPVPKQVFELRRALNLAAQYRDL